ncbi:MAG: ABC transporter substrate-binding protein [Atopobiaceae bacterium]|nr:ABC transporter substrate-binding protein [Atopobiaceae bacterium]
MTCHTSQRGQQHQTVTRRGFCTASAGLASLALAACAPAASTTEASSAQASSAQESAAQDSAAQASSSQVSTTQLSSLTKVSFVLDYSPNVNHTGIYVADRQGYFGEEGIELEIVPVPADGADALIGSGGADMGVSYQDYIANNLAAQNPMPYTAIAAIVQHNTSGIMSRAEDGITSARGMQDHVYATWNLPVEQATIKQIVEADGGDFSRVEMVPYEVDDEVAGLKAHLFDTVWVYEWWAVQNAKLQNYPVNYFAFADMDPVFDYYTPVIAVNDAFAQNNPELVRGFLRAAKRGYEFAVENPAEAARLLCEAVPELDPELISTAQEFISPEYVADASTWGIIDPTRWSRFYTWLNEEQLVENPIDVDAGYTLDYLPTA